MKVEFHENLDSFYDFNFLKQFFMIFSNVIKCIVYKSQNKVNKKYSHQNIKEYINIQIYHCIHDFFAKKVVSNK